MMPTPVLWRPESEDDLIAARSRFEHVFADWQTRWFTRTAFAVEDVTRIPPDEPWPHHDGMARHACANGIRLDLSLDAERRWIEAIYSIADSVFTSPNCHGALKSVGADIRDDWIQSIQASCAPSPAIEPDDSERNRYGAIQLRIASTDGVCLAVIVCDIQHVWAWSPLPTLAQSPRAQQMPVSRRAALNDSVITLAAWLGRCDLSAAALATLSVGDVLTLDQRLDVPLALSVDGSGAVVAAGVPGRTGAALSFQLVSLSSSLS